MDIKLFSLCKQELPESESGKKIISDCVRCFFPGCESFSAFTSQKRMLLAVSQSLRAADVVIIAVQSNMYNTTKRLLCEALEIRTDVDADVKNALLPLLETGRIKKNTYDVNVSFPVGARIMPTESGLNCGFTLTSGSQHIIYIPIESPRADEATLGSLYDFLAEICDTNPENAYRARRRTILDKLAGTLSEDKIRMAFAGEPAVSYLKSFAPDSSDIVICDKAECGCDSQELTDIAKSIRDEQSVQIAVVFGKGEDYIPVAVADESGTSIIRIYKENDEDDRDFSAACFDKAMLMLCDHRKLTSIGGDDDFDTKADKQLRKALAKLSAAVIGGSAIISIIIALIMK